MWVSQPSIICPETLQANSILAWDWPLSAFDFFWHLGLVLWVPVKHWGTPPVQTPPP